MLDEDDSPLPDGVVRRVSPPSQLDTISSGSNMTLIQRLTTVCHSQLSLRPRFSFDSDSEKKYKVMFVVGDHGLRVTHRR